VKPACQRSAYEEPREAVAVASGSGPAPARLGLAKCRTRLAGLTCAPARLQAAGGRPGAGTHGPGQTRMRKRNATFIFYFLYKSRARPGEVNLGS
jgi:hypothetical protein